MSINTIEDIQQNIDNMTNTLATFKSNLLEEYRKKYPYIYCVGVRYEATYGYVSFDHIFGYYSDVSLAEKHKPTGITRGPRHSANDGDVYIKVIPSSTLPITVFQNLDTRAKSYDFD